jgi:HKD family nuclease
MTVVFQDLARANRILDALTDLAAPSVSGIRIAVAYTTIRGAQDLVGRTGARITLWNSIPKTLITTFDYGLTEPEALSYLQASHGFAIRVANTGPEETAILRPPESFHPKLYIFDEATHLGSLIGSPNLTQRALRTNTEIAEITNPVSEPEAIEEAWKALLGTSELLTDKLLNDYREKRKTVPKPFDPEAPVPPPAPASSSLPRSVDEAVDQGLITPDRVANFWVEAGSMSSGGSYNQLELPRGAHQLFGFPRISYGGTGPATPLGNVPLIISGREPFTDRRLSWHSHNQMERLNLPTSAMGGPSYPNTVVLFRRSAAGFEMEVAPVASTLANIWRRASRANNRMFLLGAAGSRNWGVF